MWKRFQFICSNVSILKISLRQRGVYFLSLFILQISFSVSAEEVDISGEWIIDSSVGGKTPIKVYCILEQEDDRLSGECTPEMDNAQASKLAGKVNGDAAEWGYDVVFNGNPGRVDFMADSISKNEIKGILSLSGTEAPFTAKRSE